MLWRGGSLICYKGLTRAGAMISGPVMTYLAARDKGQQHAKRDFLGFGR